MDLISIPLFATPGTLELAVILLIAVLLFGASKIPELARSTGQAMGEFQRGRQEIEEELEEMKDEASLDSGTGSTDEESSLANDSDRSTDSDSN